MKKAFKAYDIRGVYDKDFNKEDVYKIGFFLPGLLNANEVLVGRDVRHSSGASKALSAGITDAGANVKDAGLCITPTDTGLQPDMASKPVCKSPPRTTQKNTTG
ncbi:MAG: hypothetical protein U5L09_06365 [Bacteroidales bacterium]|nr:hypothetical protein [Bacteroidales bacterium]